ncbi:unnamed protein product [Adineta steineri]|uniref:Uncharacterized protein n=1 Tax=Adineta steineri TaxID=433720 RepID=A0A813U7X3_9BILA|nr:unnamed protein product [Adineta steineri]CAF4045793.1 unnamed protein product [Adineta steineri]
MSMSKWKLQVLVVLSYLTWTISIIIGLIRYILHWFIFDLFSRKKPKCKWTISENEDEYYAIIIGAGFSGLGMGIKLKEMNMNKFLILERHSHVGGTWYANRYPGCQVDIPSNLYSYSFEINPQWSHQYSRQNELAEYLEACTDKYHIRSHIQFNTTVIQCNWIDERQLWQVTTNDKKTYYGRYLIGAYGLLSNASYPKDIEGLESFQGKRIAVIGTGSSAIQCIPELHKNYNISHLYVFQRTPPWVTYSKNRTLTQLEKKLFTFIPCIQKFLRAFKDPMLREKLMPKSDFGCKRILLIVTYDGNEYEIDIIIWATGYNVHSVHIPMFGIQSQSLEKQWSQTVQAYRGITVPNFPNMFLLLGPNTGLGHNSVVVMIEAQLKYIMEALIYMQENRIRAMTVKENIANKFNKEIQLKLKKSVCQVGGCHSWYQDSKGNNTTIWPGFTWTYDLLLRKFDYQNYDVISTI